MNSIAYISFIKKHISLPAMVLFFLTVLILDSCSGKHQSNNPAINLDLKEADFKNPPADTKPGIYWYWINEFISRDGITKDLESLYKIGIGEVFIGNIYVRGLPLGNVKTLSPEWLELMQFAVKEGSRIGINVSLFNSPGWSQSGGPWIRPDQSMKYLVSSRIKTQGGKSVKTYISKPTGFFQDVALLAIPSQPVYEKLHPKIISVPDASNKSALIDADTSSTCRFYNKKSESIQIDFKFDEDVAIRSIIIQTSGRTFETNCEVYSNHGGSLNLIKSLYFDRLDARHSSGPDPFAPLVIALNGETCSEYRIVMKDVPEQFEIKDIILSPAPKLEMYPEKILNKMLSTSAQDWDAYTWDNQEEVDKVGIIPVKKIIDISDYLKDDTLIWEAPEGLWEIVRIGMTSTGVTNTPTTPSAVGLEIDKMSKKSLRYHYDSYVGRVVGPLSDEERKSFRRVIADSYETGSQNWTDGLRSIFIETYGYDPIPWLSVITGNIIGSVDQSNRFLWDLRRLVADRIASEYVGGLQEVCEKNGIQLWLENYGWNGFPSEFLKYGKYAPEIGGEFWTNLGENTENRLAASASHIYGKNRVSAESYTTIGAAFEYHPYALKILGDESYTEGINNHVFHLCIHQPDDNKVPGINTWFGIELNRHNTWFDQSKAWIDYQRRCSYMLQQGIPAADVCFFIGEDTPKMSGWADTTLSKGYDYDFINADVIENILSVKEGRLTLPSGTSYALLVLPPSVSMRPAVLKRIKELIEEGANVLGSPVNRSPSLADYPNCDHEVQSLANQMWGTLEVGNKQAIIRELGLGRLFCNVPINQVMTEIGCSEAVSFSKNVPIKWKQRSLKEGQLFFITNQEYSDIEVDAKFRVGAYVPEIWNAVDGTSGYLPEYNHSNGHAVVPLKLRPAESYFIVFRNKKPQVKPNPKNNFPEEKLITTVTGNWNVRFNNKWTGEEFTIEMDTLTDWSQSEDQRIKYFSGTATYQTAFDLQTIPKDNKIYVSIEKLGVIASVNINGHDIEESVWSFPFRSDITPYIQEGNNTLAIKVSNLWKNKIVQQSQTKSPDPNFYLLSKIPNLTNADLLPSGIWGDVTIVSEF